MFAVFVLSYGYWFLQLFRQRLSHESVIKRTRQCGLALWVVRVWLCLIEVQGDSATRNENERILVCAEFLPQRWNTLRFTQATEKTTITYNNLWHCCVSFSPFVRQPFLKQLYLISHCLKVISKLPGSKTFQRKEFAPVHFQISRTYDLEISPKNIVLSLVLKSCFY